MTNVAINGYKLHEVKMLLVPHDANTVSNLRYPEHKIKSRIEGDKLFLRIPALLAVELYRRAILPQNPAQDVSIHVNEKNIGQFVVIDFRYPDSLDYDRDAVSITLQRVEKENVQAQKA